MSGHGTPTRSPSQPTAEPWSPETAAADAELERNIERLEAELANLIDDGPAGSASPAAQLPVPDLREPTPARKRDFYPTRMQQEAMGMKPLRTPDEIRQLLVAGCSPNYRGNPYLPANLSANIPDEDNCSFWIQGLPPTATCTTLLGAIRDMGRVFCTHITPPDAALGHRTAAAKLVFFDRAAAQRFFAAHAGAPLVVEGFRARVERNRTRVAASTQPAFCTRVVVVSGPADEVCVDALLRFFSSKFVYQMDAIVVRDPDAAGRPARTVEFRFGSFRNQAQTAYFLLKGRPGWRVAYGRDPCDRLVP